MYLSKKPASPSALGVLKKLIKKHILFYSFLLLFTFSCMDNEPLRTIIQTDNAPAAIGPYSQAVLVGHTLYTAGQIGLVPETGALAGKDLESQTR